MLFGGDTPSLRLIVFCMSAWNRNWRIVGSTRQWWVDAVCSSRRWILYVACSLVTSVYTIYSILEVFTSSKIFWGASLFFLLPSVQFICSMSNLIVEHVGLFLAARPAASNGLLQVFLEGGLNQQRMGVSVVAYELVWRDLCYFSSLNSSSSILILGGWFHRRFVMPLLLRKFWMLLWFFLTSMWIQFGKIPGEWRNACYLLNEPALWVGLRSLSKWASVSVHNIKCCVGQVGRPLIWMQACNADRMFCCSTFADIFDVSHFLETLSHDVNIITELPKEFEWSTREYYATGFRATRVKNAPVQASPEWYITNVLPLMRRYAYIFLYDLLRRMLM